MARSSASSQEKYVPCLLSLFRQHGYDGATLARISEATGLGKASLYHHFPGGKDEMVAAVLARSESWLEDNILQVLAEPGEAIAKLQQMCDRISELYEAGEQPCLLAILLMGSARDVFHEPVKALLLRWIDAISTVLKTAGMANELADQRGEDALIAIQGSLILSQGLNDPSPFQRTVKQLPQGLCQGL
jgi:TetR/AcrR family transcriptional repressor of lmrAB and yxaGH operons